VGVDRAPHAGGPEEGAARPTSVYILAGVLTLQGLSGIAGGVGLTLDPTGASVSIPLEWLEGSPFSDYLVPGLVLLVVLGVGPLVVAYGVWTERKWAWAASIFVGLSLLIWLGVEIAVVGYQAEPPLQLIYGIVALAILGAAFVPSVRADLT
jgi:hypothetical protein